MTPPRNPPTNRNAAPGYDIGYSKPPQAKRFKPGQSGNPSGRPKGARNKMPAPHEERLQAIVMAEAYRTIKVNDGARQITVPMAQAVIRSLAVSAAKGQAHAQKLFTEILGATERAKRKIHDEVLDAIFEYKADWQHEQKRRAQLEITGPEPLPHPDDLIVDTYTGNIRIRGPFDEEELARWQHLATRRDDAVEDITELEALLAQPENAYMEKFLKSELSFEKRSRDTITDAIGNWPHDRGLKSASKQTQRGMKKFKKSRSILI